MKSQERARRPELDHPLKTIIALIFSLCNLFKSDYHKLIINALPTNTREGPNPPRGDEPLHEGRLQSSGVRLHPSAHLHSLLPQLRPFRLGQHLQNLRRCLRHQSPLSLQKDSQKVSPSRISPAWEIPKFLTEYVRSTSLTAVQMMLMRRILCFLCKHLGNKQSSSPFTQTTSFWPTSSLPSTY